MFGAIDEGTAVLALLMLALGAGPALLALASRRARAPRFEAPRPAHGLFFGAATAARCTGPGGF